MVHSCSLSQERRRVRINDKKPWRWTRRRNLIRDMINEGSSPKEIPTAEELDNGREIASSLDVGLDAIAKEIGNLEMNR